LNFKVNKKAAKSSNKKIKDAYDKEKKKFCQQQIDRFTTNFCNFGSHYAPILAYQKLLGIVFGKFTPLRIRVECSLFHGCD
jgi:hypothetical protein